MSELIAHGHIAAAINVWSRHATPKPFCHLIIKSPMAGRLFNAFVVSDIIFALWHSLYGDWDAVDAGYKLADGGWMHRFASTPEVIPARIPDRATGYPGWPAFGANDQIELMVKGHLSKFSNGFDANGAEISAWEDDGLGLTLAVRASASIWRTGEDWGNVDRRYKASGGTAILEASDAKPVPIVTHPARRLSR